MCKCGLRTVPVKCCRSFTSYMDLVDKLCFKFSGLRFDSVRLFYNLRDYDGCVLENDDDLEVMFSLAGCYGVEVIDVTVLISGGSNGCFGSDVVAIGVNRCESSCLTTDVGSVGLCGGSSDSYGSIFTSSNGKGSAVSCLTTDVGSVGLCGGGSGSYGSIFTSSKGKAPGVSCLGDVAASGVSGSSDGLCTDVGSCSSSKGKGLGVIRSEWRLDVEKERDLLPTFCQHRDHALLSDGWRHYIKEVNQKFEGGAVEFRDKLAKFAIFYGFDYSFAKNEKDRVTAFCKDADCKWRVHARLDKVSTYFYIRSFYDIHSCGASVLTTKHSRASSSMIGRLMSADIRTTPQKRPVDVVSSLKGLYGVDVPYKRAWKGVEKGRSEAFGDYDASFDELRWYREAVRNSDPESVFEIEVDTETNRFQRLFVAFSACISGFKHLRPLLFVDGTFLKGNFKGSLLSASAKDGDKAKWRQVLCPTMDEALAIAFQESKAWEVKFSSPDVLEVLCNPSVKVDIGRHSCTCTQWQLNGVPCVHAVCAIKKSGKSLNACVERYFHVECYREAYSRPIMPVPTLWKPEVAGDAVILPPISRKPPGRNKKKRIRSFGEKVRAIKCARCGKRGSHNRRSCKEAIN
ncbi:hypothetical protein RHSIM_Rhsim12G0033400 [Rhododendron simsii]|uniref:SWIM-type domain-containing protein n=1 Tax=Rhododendron simsii TaxID=118357 RepID=A0A834G5I1_RHOSS|nr:hypothetical protein RHSIM_Rhsim12G0033400 [Rhododendron simsii]